MRNRHRLLVLLAVLLLLGLVPLAQATAPADPTSEVLVPLWLKVGCTLFVAVLVPVYGWYYGPANFLWFSDLALFLALAALWLEDPLPAGMGTLSVGLLELLWLTDFLARLLFGVSPPGLAEYMFDPKIPLPVRGLSLFHVPLPLLLFWLTWRLGYDPRALPAQTVLAWVVLLACHFFTRPSENINWVFGPGSRPQTALPSGLYLALVLAFFPVCVYLPAHLLLRAVCPPARASLLTHGPDAAVRFRLGSGS
jgi:hypothetical protein